MVAELRQHCVENNIVRNFDNASGGPGPNGPLRRIDIRRDLHLSTDGSVSIRRNQRCSGDGVGLESQTRCPARDCRQQNRREKRDNREDAHDLEQRETVV